MARWPRNIEARHLLTLSEVVGDRSVVAVTVGPRLDPVILSLGGEPDYRTEGQGATFPKRRAGRPNRFRIHHLVGDDWKIVDLPETAENYHAVQPLRDGEWLLVRGRADGDGDENARVYDGDGHHLRSFPAGDGIQDVQATTDGRIWLSYFDEGVFGDTTLGRSGLVCLGVRGECLFTYSEVLEGGFPDICDCYALNVASGEITYLYYYTEFPLVKLVGGKVESLWTNIPVDGSSGFAVHRDTALFAGGYDDRDHLHLVQLGENRTRNFVPTDEEGQPLTNFSAFGRSARLFLRTGDALHAVEVPTETAS